jgi:hypothetical protein
LLDIGFLDEASVKLSAKLAQEVRTLTRLPIGGAPCNGMYMWGGFEKPGEGAFMAALSATLGYVAATWSGSTLKENTKQKKWKIKPLTDRAYEIALINAYNRFPEEYFGF